MSNKEHRSTQRVIDVLELLAFSDNTQGFTLTEIANHLNSPKSSLSPILHTLLDNGYLSFNASSSKYLIGRRLYEVGNTYVKDDNFYFQMLQIMRNVVNLCSETCHIAELNGTNVLYLLKVDSPENIRMFSAPGKKLPAHATALGKALLSTYTLKELEDLYPSGLSKVTDKTITDIEVLYKQLLKVRSTGYAFEEEENAEFIQCIATPIYKGDSPVMAISVSIPTFRYSAEKEELIKQLLFDAKKDIEKLI